MEAAGKASASKASEGRHAGPLRIQVGISCSHHTVGEREGEYNFFFFFFCYSDAMEGGEGILFFSKKKRNKLQRWMDLSRCGRWHFVDPIRFHFIFYFLSFFSSALCSPPTPQYRDTLSMYPVLRVIYSLNSQYLHRDGENFFLQNINNNVLELKALNYEIWEFSLPPRNPSITPSLPHKLATCGVC